MEEPLGRAAHDYRGPDHLSPRRQATRVVQRSRRPRAATSFYGQGHLEVDQFLAAATGAWRRLAQLAAAG